MILLAGTHLLQEKPDGCHGRQEKEGGEKVRRGIRIPLEELNVSKERRIAPRGV
jgi:hypothetical protein